MAAGQTRSETSTDPTTLWRDFNQTLAACAKQVDAFHLTLQAAHKLGAVKGAICMADAALQGKLVVRLSLGFEGASNKVLAASAPGRTAAFEAFAHDQMLVVPDYASSDYSPTALEAHHGVTGAAYLPIRTRRKGAQGLLLAVSAPGKTFDTDTLVLFEQMASALGTSLERLASSKPFVLASPAELTELPAGLFEAFRRCLNTDDIETLSAAILEQCRDFTGSNLGFVGYVDPATGYLNCPTMTRDIFAQCKVAGKTVVFEKAGGLGGWVLDQKAPLIANDPSAHPASVGTPPGHLPIRRFMGVPCFSQARVMGMIALANKDSDYTGHDLRIVSAFADIYAAAVARFLSERELTASRNRLASLYDTAPCGYQTLAPDGLVIEANETALRMLARPREEVIGRLIITDLLTTTGKALLADQIRDLNAHEAVAPVELHLRRPDGARLPVLHSVSATRDERGFVQQIRCTLVDVSLRKALRETRDYLETLFKHSASPIIVWDSLLTITRFNQGIEQLTGYCSDEVIGQPLAMLFPEAERAALMERIGHTRHGGRLESAELPICTRSGDHKTVLWNSSNLYAEDGVELLATVAQGVDITDRKSYELALRKTNRALKTLSHGNEILVRATSEMELLQGVCDILVQVGGYRLAWIGFVEHDAQKHIRPVARAGNGIDYLDHVTVTWDDSPTGRGPGGMAVRRGEPQVFQDVLHDPRFHPWRAAALERGYASNAAFPLKHKGQVLGLLALYGDQAYGFDPDEMRLLNELVNDVAFGIVTLRTRAAHAALELEREHHLQRLRETMEATVQAVAATIEKRDPYTAGHQQRVARLAVAIATHMGLSPQQIEGVHFGSLIHDIGKISVPAEILSKPGALAAMEFELIKAHAAAGQEILKGVKFPWPIIDMVSQHHERMNGSGYPHGLAGEAIRLEARIIGVADVVEAMSSFRPYRPALGMDSAMAEITERSGTLYDAEVVAACLHVLHGGFRFDEPG